MKFEFDPQKSENNLKKQGISLRDSPSDLGTQEQKRGGGGGDLL